MAKQRKPEDKYTDPELHEEVKEEVQASDKGGRPGQWSARKAQLVTNEYKKRGGDFKGGRDESQKHLQQWGEEDWHTKDGDGKAEKGKTSGRYLPDKAWKLLSKAEREATDKKKSSKKGAEQQHVPNTDAAKAARKVMDLDELKAGDAKQLVKGLDTELELKKAKKAEKSGPARKSVLEAIEKRLDQVK